MERGTWPRSLPAALLAWLLLACVISLPASAAVAPTRPLTVFAAASLKESLDAVAVSWTRQSGQKVVVSYAASSALARQIERGAPADVFIAADREWMDYLQQRHLIDNASRSNLLRNQLVLIAPTHARLPVVALDQPATVLRALGDGRLALAETRSVPAGRYAAQALHSLGLWDHVATHLAQGENVRAAMAFVARDEAPLGIVYATDAQAEPRVRVVARFPADSHAPIIYPVAGIAGSAAARAAGFLAFLKTAPARAAFLRAGFSAP